jgi:glucose/arabinose dehydrogenase
MIGRGNPMATAIMLRTMRTTICSLVLAAISLASLQAQMVPGLDAIRVASGLTQPLFATAPPGDSGRLFIVQQNGRIRILNLATGTLNPTPFLALTGLAAGGEQGLLGMAFDPNYAANGKFYLNFTVPGGAFGNGVTHVSQFTVSANPNIADPTSERILIGFDHPQASHNGGWIGFSPRAGDANNLYIATGDGGGANDQGPGHIEPGGNAQSLTTLLGKMLRIHINSTAGTYTIPANNPFVGVPGARGEIWAFGLRNPFRSSFDRQTGRMFIGDVGQSSREEIDVQQPTHPGGGENYGWRVREGSVQNPAYPGIPTPPGAINPIFDYPRSVGRTVIGGYVYRGRQIPNLRGVYVFADWNGPESGPGTGQIFTLNYNGTFASNFQNVTAQLFPTRAGGFALSNPSSLGEDSNGELYITDIGNGSVFKIVGPPVKSDFNGDGKPDILWQDSSTGKRVIWIMNNTTHTSTVNLGTVATSWSIAGSSDFNGDGKPDILWQDSSTGKRVIWIMNNTTHTSTVNLGTVATSWSIAGSSDFNGDGKSDILWQDSSTGQRAIWIMNNTTLQSAVSLGTVATSWSIAGSNDFNGDGKPDILWQDSSTGKRVIWIMNNTTHTSTVNLGTVATSWSIAGSNDFNGDGKPDILWQDSSTGKRVIWIMNNTTHTSTVNLEAIATSWSIRNY